MIRPVFFLSHAAPGDELESMQPSLYRNVARQLNISVAMENMVSDAFIAVATEILSTGTCSCLAKATVSTSPPLFETIAVDLKRHLLCRFPTDVQQAKT